VNLGFPSRCVAESRVQPLSEDRRVRESGFSKLRLRRLGGFRHNPPPTRLK
jgi:hypothetical protein